MGRTRHRYGARRGQIGDLWLPEHPGAPRLPVVVLIHGGYWRAPYTKALMAGLARAVVGRGWAAWNVEYRRMGALGGGGGWPATLGDVGAAVDHLSTFSAVDPERVVTCGHSAGGCLALWVAHRNRGPEAPSPTRVVQPRAALSLAGVVDLRRGAELGLGRGAVAEFLGGSFEQYPDRYRSSSPAALLPLGIPHVLVHGLDDTVVPPAMSRDYHASALRAGDDATYLPIEGSGHRDVIDPAASAWPVVAGQLERLFRT